MNKEDYKREEQKLLDKGYNIFQVDALLSRDIRKTALANAYKTGDLRLYASICSMYRNAEKANELEEAMTETYEDNGERTL